MSFFGVAGFCLGVTKAGGEFCFGIFFVWNKIGVKKILGSFVPEVKVEIAN